jgi:integrase/recombinase XerC
MLLKFEQYLLTEKRYSEHTLKAYLMDVEQFLNFLNTDEQIDYALVRSSDIRSWIVALFDEGATRKTINRKLSSLRTLFKWLKKEGVVSLNPLTKVNGPKNEKRLPQFAKESDLKADKLEHIFDVDFNGVRDRLMFEFFYQTGMRLSELVNLKESDVSHESIRVIGKRNKERILPISSELSRQISAYRKMKSGIGITSLTFFVLENGNNLYPKFVYRKINYYLGGVTNLDKTSPHILRHTFATHMLNNGAGLETLKDLLGHASLSATQVYTHNSFAQLTRIYSQAHPRGQKT